MSTGDQPAPAAGAIVVEDVHKSFGANEVLSGISLAVAAHEVICLIGASGSGKSTLLRCINLLEPIDSGRISLLGQQVTGPGIDANRVRRAVGIVFQSYNLFPHMTVLRNVTLAPIKALGMTKAQATELASELLARFGLVGQAGRVPGSAVRRTAAASGHRPGPGNAAADHAPGRGDERARP